MEAARKIFTVCFKTTEVWIQGIFREAQKAPAKAPVERSGRGQKGTPVTGLSGNRMGQTGISRSVPTVCGTLSCNPGIGGLGFQYAWNQNAFF